MREDTEVSDGYAVLPPFTLKMEAAWLSEKSVSYHIITTLHHKSGDREVKLHRRESLELPIDNTNFTVNYILIRL
jgi:hypothetical protein